MPRGRLAAALSVGRNAPLGKTHRALRATSERNGSAAIARVAGEIDACNRDGLVGAKTPNAISRNERGVRNGREDQ
jgi:hypothetical protein